MVGLLVGDGCHCKIVGDESKSTTCCCAVTRALALWGCPGHVRHASTRPSMSLATASSERARVDSCYRKGVLSEQLFDQCLLARHGVDAWHTLTSTNHMGRLLVQTGRHDEAVALLSAVETAERRVFLGGNADRLAFFLRTLGDAHVGLAQIHDFASAEARLLEALSI